MKKMAFPQWLKDIENWVSLGLIAAISALTYLPLIGQLGLYHEAWYIIWAGRTQDLSTLISMFSIDRPMIGYIYMRTYLLLGDNPLAWQVFAYLLRMAGAIGFFLLLRQIWPRKQLFTTTAAILFVVYPGFLQWPNAVVYSLLFLSYAFAIYSILFTVMGIRATNKYAAIFTVCLAILFQVGYLFIDEYILGLEGLRLILICSLIFLSPQLSLKAKLTKAFLRWAPHLTILGGFLFWRIFIFKSNRPTTDVLRLLGLYSSMPFSMIQKAVANTFRGFLDAVIFAWTTPFSQLISITRNRDLLVGVVLAILASAVFWMYFHWTRTKESNVNIVEETGAFRRIIWIGLVTVFCAILPVTISNRSIAFSIGGTDDRYTLHTTIGIVLLIVGSIFLLNRNRGRLWLPMGLLFLSVLTQYSNAVYFRNAWETQQQLWWQLAWRAPQFEEGTILMVNLPSDVYSYAEDYEIWAPANIIYTSIPNTLRIYSQVLYPGSAIQIMRGAEEHENIRTIEYDRDYNRALIVSMPSVSSCVHVIDGERPTLSLNEPPIVDWVAPYSHIQQIDSGTTPPQPPEIIFGQEPPHIWCYYYQKMSLARQQGNWAQVVALGEEAINAGFKPLDRSEWMPLIEAYAYKGNFEMAENIIVKLYEISNLRYNLCVSVLKQKENPGLTFSEEGMNFLTNRLCNSDWKKP